MCRNNYTLLNEQTIIAPRPDSRISYAFAFVVQRQREFVLDKQMDNKPTLQVIVPLCHSSCTITVPLIFRMWNPTNRSIRKIITKQVCEFIIVTCFWNACKLKMYQNAFKQMHAFVTEIRYSSDLQNIWYFRIHFMRGYQRYTIFSKLNS